MTLEAKARIGFGHPNTIVHHLNRSFSTILYYELNGLAPRINGVLQQLLNYRSGTLNHLACSNLVGN